MEDAAAVLRRLRCVLGGLTVSLLSAGMFPLSSINKRLVEIIEACYSNKGIIDERAAVYAPYSSKSEELCSTNSQVSSVCA